MALALRQSYIAAGSSLLAAISVVAGDLVIVCYYSAVPLTDTTCTDNASGGSNAYVELSDVADIAQPSSEHMFYTIAKATETLAITCASAGGGYRSIFVHVVSGNEQNPNLVVDSHIDKQDSTAGTAHTSGVLTLGSAPRYVICFWSEPAGTGTVSTAGSFTERKEDAGTATYDLITSSAGDYSCSVTSTISTRYVSILAAFKEASAPVVDEGGHIVGMPVNMGTLMGRR